MMDLHSPVRTHTSAPAAPEARGEELGTAYAPEIGATVDGYRELFATLAGSAVDLGALGGEALDAIAAFSADAAAEIRGIAGGAGLEPSTVAALNARTEILARLRRDAPLRGECSTVVDMRTPTRGPVTMQTWDWHDTFADSWFVWTIEQPDGAVFHTVTEFGILAKIGVSSRGIGIHMNILQHDSDGGRFRVPVHILSRAVLERCTDAGAAAALLGAAEVSASSVLTVVAGATAVGAELAPAGPRWVLPSADGLYIHTNHFLDPHLAGGDQAPRLGPDSYLRLDVLRRALRSRRVADSDELRAVLTDHSAGAGSVCCHPDPTARLGDRWATLATVTLDVQARQLTVRPGAPCDAGAPQHTCHTAPADAPVI